ncbi:MAG TPA: tetratricopeptide repeat protein, partial [Gemmataceae bacterium]|nr:tetratricopeptide repeat protein [Gemmataceae bacterium]
MKKALMHRNAAQRISRVRLRGRFLWMTLLGLAVLATVVVGAAWYRMAAPAPPTVSLSDLDPAVAAAIETAQRGVREQPRSGSAWGRLGMVLLTHDFPAEARICLTQAARFDPREPRWPYFQGIVLHQEEPDSAIPELQRAVELCGDEVATPRLLLAEILYAQGRRDEAEAQFQQVLHHEPGNARAHLGLGRLASWRGQGAECIRHLDAAKADPRTRKASLTLLAEVYQRLGDQRAADQVLRQLATLPDDAAWPDPFLQELLRLQTGQKAYLDRANRLLDQGHTAEAVALLQQAVREYPNADWTWLLLGKAFLKRKELPPAVEALRN